MAYLEYVGAGMTSRRLEEVFIKTIFLFSSCSEIKAKLWADEGIYIFIANKEGEKTIPLLHKRKLEHVMMKETTL